MCHTMLNLTSPRSPVMPLGPEIKDNDDGTICVGYEPHRVGRHEVLMSFDGSGVDGEFSVTVHGQGVC